MREWLTAPRGSEKVGDVGLGILTIRRLRQVAELPEEVQVLDGGTLGLGLLHYLEGVSHLLIVDSLETGQPPGTVKRLSGEEVPAYLALKMSPHEIGLPDMLFAAKLRDLYPAEVVIWGAQPATVEVGLDLSPAVARQVDVLVSNILEELDRWGIEPQC